MSWGESRGDGVSNRGKVTVHRRERVVWVVFCSRDVLSRYDDGPDPESSRPRIILDNRPFP